MRRSFSVISAVVAVVTTFLVSPPGTGVAHAATSFVPCDTQALIANIISAGSGDTLSLASGCTYTLTKADNDANGLPVIAKTLTIVGNGATITRSSADAFRIFEVRSGGNLTLSGLTLSNGQASGQGGAILNNGTLTVTATLSGNSAASGGAISNTGMVTVTGSTLVANSVSGGVAQGGGIFNAGVATVRASTLFANSANDDLALGGGISNADTLVLTASTLFGNSANGGFAQGGGVFNAGAATVANSIVADSPSGGNCAGAVADGGHNIDSGSTCGFLAATGSFTNTDPQLGALADHGGPTQTMAPSPTSVAVNAVPAGDLNCTGTDQRGVPRPQGAGCDIGAFEAVATTTTLTSDKPLFSGETITLTATVTPSVAIPGQPTGTVAFFDGATQIGTGTLNGGDPDQATFTIPSLSPGSHSFRAVYPPNDEFLSSTSAPLRNVLVPCDVGALIAEMGADSDGDTLSLASGCTYTLTAVNADVGNGPDGLPPIAKTLNIVGNGATITRSPSAPAFRIFEVTSGGDLTLIGLTVSNGRASCDAVGVSCSARGGGILNAGRVTLTGSTLSGSSASCTASVGASCSASGGGIFNAGRVTLTGSTLSGNSAFVGQDGVSANGGGISGGTVMVTGSTLSGNRVDCSSLSNCIPEGGGISGGTVTVTDSTVSGNAANGLFSRGGGISGGTVTVTNSTLSGNSSNRGIFGSCSCRGGGISGGTVTVTDSTLSGNSIDCSGGSCMGGGISGDSVTVTGSTLFANSAGSGGNGGGIFNQGTATVTNSTLSGNSATFGGDISSGGAVTVTASIVANSCSGAVVDGGHNIDGGFFCGFSAANDSFSNTDPQLGALADNGGPNRTMGLRPGSPAINAVPAADCAVNTDQRGVGRPQGAGCDIGAFEVVATSTTLASSGNPSAVGQAITLTATVTPAVAFPGQPRGTVAFFDGATQIGTATLNGASPDQATFTTSSLSAGSHSLTAVYQGSEVFLTSTSAVLTQAVNRVATTTSLISSANPSLVGEAVTFTATVTANEAGTPTGTVTFKEGSTTLGTASLSGGSASFTTSSLSTGSHSITAVYSGDANFAASTSAALTQRVLIPTATMATSSANPSTFGQAVTFTATVTTDPPAAGPPTGTVTFRDGDTVLGTATLFGDSASFTTSTLSPGNHRIRATYNGDDEFAPSTSSAFTQVVNRAATTTSLTSSANPSVFGQAVNFTATVTANPPGGGTPSGTVTFRDGSTVLGTASLSGGSASFTTSTLSVGSHSITATYSGDGDFFAPSSAALTQVVNKAATTTSVTSSANPSVEGDPVTFTATVTASPPGAGTPTGTVTFMDGATVLGTATLSGGVATFTTSALDDGTHTITAVYSGDANFTSSSGSMTQVVNKKAAAMSTEERGVERSFVGVRSSGDGRRHSDVAARHLEVR